jgi:excisionase family DNA binding protein
VSPSFSPPEALLSVRQVATVLGVHRATIYKLAESGALPCVRVGESIRFRPEDLKAFTAAPTRSQGATP